MKKIGVITTGGDCSGLNSVIYRLAAGGRRRGHQMFGILDGTDGLTIGAGIVPLEMPLWEARLAGSILKNGNPKIGRTIDAQVKSALQASQLDALVLIGGNGSLSLAHNSRDVYGDLQLVCIPKTIDMDIPLTDSTIGFATAVQQLTAYCDQLLLTARSHHRWFVVQTMGRDSGNLALNAGIAIGASAILIPEIKFRTENLIRRITESGAPLGGGNRISGGIAAADGGDHGIILVSEGIKMRGHSGAPAEMISRELTKAGIANRTAFPEHTQRAGDTTATDRLLAARFADCALDAIDAGETYVMTAMQSGICKTIPLEAFWEAGEKIPDPNIADMRTSNAFVAAENPLLKIAIDSGIYIGEVK